jgi:nicotinic acid mononucleotide adenylyltransferase
VPRPDPRRLHQRGVAGSYDTIEALREADRLSDYLEWIRGTDKLDVKTD